MAEFNNIAKISGIILEEFQFSHQCREKKFYTTKVLVRRESGKEDIINVITSEELICPEVKNTYVKIGGQFRSFNEDGEDSKRHLKLFLYVNDIKYFEFPTDENCIELRGIICKPPNFRKKFGNIITELCLAVSRNYKKSDYIPCVAWGYYATYASELKVGDEINLVGRIQRREYRNSENPKEIKETFEVSTVWMEKN